MRLGCGLGIIGLLMIRGQSRARGVITNTDEKEPVVTTSVKRRAIRACVGFDTARSMFKEYGVGGIPHTALVSSNGVLAGSTHPAALSATRIRDVRAGNAPKEQQP